MKWIRKRNFQGKKNIFRITGILGKKITPFCAERAKCKYLPIKWINNTREFCPKGQFVYFVIDLVKLQANVLETVNGNTKNKGENILVIDLR